MRHIVRQRFSRRRERDLEAAQRGVDRVRTWPPESPYPFVRLLTICDEVSLSQALSTWLMPLERVQHIADVEAHWDWHLRQFRDRLTDKLRWAVGRWIQVYALLAGDVNALPPLAAAAP